MAEFSIAFIKKHANFPDKRLTQEELREFVMDCFEIKVVDSDSMMECIVDEIEMDPKEDRGDTVIVVEDEDSLVQCVYKDPGKKKESDLNMLATNISVVEKQAILGKAALVKSTIQEDGTCVPASLEVSDLVKIMDSKLAHTGVKVTTSGEVTEFKYSNTPIEANKEYTKDNCTVVEFSAIDFSLVAFLPKTGDKMVNKKVTRVLGDKKVYGDVLIIGHYTMSDRHDFTKSMFHKLHTVLSGRLSKRELSQEENISGEYTEDGKQLTTNKFRTLHTRFIEFKDQCVYCWKPIIERLTCTGCHRVMYCSRKCQISDWRAHQSHCLHKAKWYNDQPPAQSESQVKPEGS